MKKRLSKAVEKADLGKSVKRNGKGKLEKGKLVKDITRLW